MRLRLVVICLLFSMLLVGCGQLTIKADNPKSDPSTKPNTNDSTSQSVDNQTSNVGDKNSNRNEHSSNTSSSLLKRLKLKAESGKVLHSQFALGSTKEQIVTKYGSPDADSTTDSLHYKKYYVIFRLDEAGKVIRIETTDPQLFKVTLKQVEIVFGTANGDGAAGSIYYSYPLGSFTLVFRWSNVEQKWAEIYVQYS